MMKPWIKPDDVRRHVPDGCQLPARFDAFVRAEQRFRVEWNDLDAYSLKPTATEEAVPFLRLSDGGLVALWYRDAAPAVVHIGGHGELRVLARGFDDFLRSLNARCSGLSDFDDADPPVHIPGVAGQPDRDGLAALQEEFGRWFQTHTSLLKPLASPEAEALRRRVYGIAEAMIRDGLSTAFPLSDSRSWWALHFQIDRAGDGLALRYRNYGKWYPVPDGYGLGDEVAALLQLVQDKGRDRYELAVHCAGIVSIDRDRQLLLVAPKAAPGGA